MPNLDLVKGGPEPGSDENRQVADVSSAQSDTLSLLTVLASVANSLHETSYSKDVLLQSVKAHDFIAIARLLDPRYQPEDAIRQKAFQDCRSSLQSGAITPEILLAQITSYQNEVHALIDNDLGTVWEQISRKRDAQGAARRSRAAVEEKQEYEPFIQYLARLYLDFLIARPNIFTLCQQQQADEDFITAWEGADPFMRIVVTVSVLPGDANIKAKGVAGIIFKYFPNRDEIIKKYDSSVFAGNFKFLENYFAAIKKTQFEKFMFRISDATSLSLSQISWSVSVYSYCKEIMSGGIILEDIGSEEAQKDEVGQAATATLLPSVHGRLGGRKIQPGEIVSNVGACLAERGQMPGAAAKRGRVATEESASVSLCRTSFPQVPPVDVDSARLMTSEMAIHPAYFMPMQQEEGLRQEFAAALKAQQDVINQRFDGLLSQLTRFTNIEQQLSGLSQRLESVERANYPEKMNEVDAALAAHKVAMDARLAEHTAAVDTRLAACESKQGDLESQLAALQETINQLDQQVPPRVNDLFGRTEAALAEIRRELRAVSGGSSALTSQLGTLDQRTTGLSGVSASVAMVTADLKKYRADFTVMQDDMNTWRSSVDTPCEGFQGLVSRVDSCEQYINGRARRSAAARATLAEPATPAAPSPLRTAGLFANTVGNVFVPAHHNAHISYVYQNEQLYMKVGDSSDECVAIVVSPNNFLSVNTRSQDGSLEEELIPITQLMAKPIVLSPIMTLDSMSGRLYRSIALDSRQHFLEMGEDGLAPRLIQGPLLMPMI